MKHTAMAETVLASLFPPSPSISSFSDSAAIAAANFVLTVLFYRQLFSKYAQNVAAERLRAEFIFYIFFLIRFVFVLIFELEIFGQTLLEQIREGLSRAQQTPFLFLVLLPMMFLLFDLDNLLHTYFYIVLFILFILISSIIFNTKKLF
jgi:hypothetical protein